MQAMDLSASSLGFPTAITPELATIIGIFSCAAVFLAYCLALQPPRRRQRLRRTTRRGRYDRKLTIRTCQLPSSTPTNNPKAKAKVKVEDEHSFHPSAKSSIKDRVHRRLKISKLRHSDTTTKVTCHIIGYHPIARNRARYNQLNSKSVRSFDKHHMDGSNIPSYKVRNRIHFLCNHVQHTIARNRSNYNQKPIELNSERIGSFHEESTITVAVAMNKLSEEGFTPNFQFPCEDIMNRAVNDKSNKSKHATMSDSSDNKENVNPEIEKCNNMATANAANEEPTTTRALLLLPVTGCSQNHDDGINHDSNHLVRVAKQSEKTYTPSNLDVNDDDRNASLQTGNPPTLRQNNISEADAHPKSSNNRGFVSADQTTSHLTVLISSGIYEYIQASRQRDALSLLNDLNISYVIVDGMDQSQKVKRDELFKISGIRGNYPQLFSTTDDGNSPRYLGGYDWLQSTNIQELGEIVRNTSS